MHKYLEGRVDFATLSQLNRTFSDHVGALHIFLQVCWQSFAINVVHWVKTAEDDNARLDGRGGALGLTARHQQLRSKTISILTRD